MIFAGFILLIIFETCIGAAKNAASDDCYWDQMQTKKYYTQNVDRDLARFLKQDPKLACFVKEKLDECFASQKLGLNFDSNLIDTNSMTNPEIDYLRINYACKFSVTETDRKCMLNELGTLYEYDGCNSTKAKINEASKKVTEKCGKALGCFTQKFMTLSFLSERIHLRPCFSVSDGRIMNICDEDKNYSENNDMAIVKRENTNYTDIPTSTTSAPTTTVPTAGVKRDMKIVIFEGLKKTDSSAEMENEGGYRERKIEITFQLPSNIPTENNGASIYASSLTLFVISLLLTCYI